MTGNREGGGKNKKNKAIAGGCAGEKITTGHAKITKGRAREEDHD
jgi:hypothetical protein